MKHHQTRGYQNVIIPFLQEVLVGERWGQIRGVGWQVKGVGSSSSTDASQVPFGLEYFSHASAAKVVASWADTP